MQTLCIATSLYSCCASYVIAAMLDEFGKLFPLFAIQTSSNMAGISLSFESLALCCSPTNS
jgi:hypothetical protein